MRLSAHELRPGWVLIRQPLVELTRPVECSQFHEATNALAMNKDLWRGVLSRRLRHPLAQIVTVDSAHLLKGNPPAPEQLLGTDAVGTKVGCINNDGRHWASMRSGRTVRKGAARPAGKSRNAADFLGD